MGRHVGNAFLGLIGGYFGVLLAGGFYEMVWGNGLIGVWMFRKTFLWLSDYFILVPIVGGIFGGATSDNFWGAVVGGFFLALVGFFVAVLLLGVAY